MRGMIGALLAILAVLSHAQFWERLGNPTVTVGVDHPPRLDLQAERLAFGPATGQCADELVQSLVTDLVQHGMDVIDRANLDTILKEFDFAASGHVDPATAVEMGEMLGPSAMVMIDVTRCAAETKTVRRKVERTVPKKDGEYERVSETVNQEVARGFLKLSVRTVDLTTGRIFAARAFDYQPTYPPIDNTQLFFEGDRSLSGMLRKAAELEHLEAQGPPTADTLLSAAMADAVRDIRRMFLPWTEEIHVVFYDDRKCGLKNAYQALRVGDVDRALSLSQRNLTTCQDTPRVKDKLLARAYYNVGILRVLRGEYDDALDLLNVSADLRPSAIVSEAIAGAQTAKERAATMANFEQDALLKEEERQMDEERRREEIAQKTLRNQDILDLVGEEVPQSVILSMVRNSIRDFDTSPSAIVELVRSGVAEDIINAMVETE